VTIEIPVKNLSEARKWYERLLQRRAPDSEPIPGVTEYKIADTWLQLAEGDVGKTDWTFRIGVKNLVAERNRLQSLA
jgi:hypothetical protein